MAYTSSEVKYLINHLFLPSKLPSEDDWSQRREAAVLSASIEGLIAWKECCEPERNTQASAAILMLRKMGQVHSTPHGYLIEDKVYQYMQSLVPGDAFPLHIREQNAGVLIRRDKSSVSFEIFEVSPTNEGTTAAQGRLTRCFPGTGAVLEAADFDNPALQKTIAHTLTELSMHSVAAMEPKVKKSNNELHENRDTTHPGMVSEMFLGFLRAIGRPMACPTIKKNTRDEVLWKDCLLPWRRSPWWLVIRVCLQLFFRKGAAEPADRDGDYKEAMLFILRHVLIRVLPLEGSESVASDLLHIMNAKLARRMLKIDFNIHPKILPCIEESIKGTHAILSKRWSLIQKKDAQPLHLSRLSKLNIIGDSQVDIPDLDKHLVRMKDRQTKRNQDRYNPSSTLMVTTPDELPRFPGSFPNKNNAIVNLEAFETWVALHARDWSRTNQSTASQELGALVVKYHKLALEHYAGNPEALSIMLLTIFELWVALDAATIAVCPLLGKYKPGVPWAELQNLLLAFESQRQRLHHVESYLHDRSCAQLSNTELLGLTTVDCFPVRYFNNTPSLQKKHRDILAKAEVDKQAKLAEYHALKEKHADLLRRAGNMECEYVDVLVDYYKDIYEERHKYDCRKCDLESQARNLGIHVFEWPLPEHPHKAKAIVFELCVPSFFQHWRDVTFYLLRDVMEREYAQKVSPRAQYPLHEDCHLPVESHRVPDIGLLSQNKPHVVTHRDEQKIATASEQTVCLNNGLNYEYFDFTLGVFVSDLRGNRKVMEMCTYRLPSLSQSLQKYLFRPPDAPDGPAPNESLANPSETPKHMSLEEARDLASLPLGCHIQMHNILVQLAAPSLDFRKEETAIFILQCLHQVGPSDTQSERTSIVTDEEAFAMTLLDNIQVAWHRVKENWESAQALSVFVAITAHVLSLTHSEEVRERSFAILSILRAGAFAWIELLEDKSHNAQKPDDRTFFKTKSENVALICASSFDVEERHLFRILASPADASIFVQCSMIIQEAKRRYDVAFELVWACLSLRFYRLLFRTLSFLSVTHAGITDAVGKAWSEYRPGRSWRLASGTTHWLVTESAAEGSQCGLQVHYNLISGELLVSGSPLDGLPQAYEAFPMMKTLFGDDVLAVMPTSVPGMQFSAKLPYEGYNIWFGLDKETPTRQPELLVQACNATAKYDLLPARLFQGIFPVHFVNDFVHWYNQKNGTVEFRSAAKPWTLSASAWILSKASGAGWMLKSKGNTLLGMHNRTATLFAELLSPLAEKEDVHLILQPSRPPVLEVDIPTLQFGFHHTAGESSLRSREFPGMLVDEDQALGTLVGLDNKLVLTDKDRRLVLVPEGKVSWESGEGHTCVTISRKSITRVHALHVDPLLGRLIDNGNLQCKLFVSYLHALTSYCLPDPLTKRTGVEEALSILNSAAVLSFDRLSQQNIDVLADIAQLVPSRRLYPKHLRSMQVVSWDTDLSQLSQHDGFYQAANAILKNARRMNLFYPGQEDQKLLAPLENDRDRLLMERDRIRSSAFRTSGFGAEEHRTDCDREYHGRDRSPDSTLAKNAFTLSSLIYHPRAIRHEDALRNGQLWEILRRPDSIHHPAHDVPWSYLSYNAEAANVGLDLSLCLALWKKLSSGEAVIHRFSIMIWLSTLASHKSANMSLLQTFALFFAAPDLKNSAIEMPTTECKPSYGFEATFYAIEQRVRCHLHSIYGTPEIRLNQNHGEGWKAFQRRRQSQFDSHQHKAINALVAMLCSLWPRPTLPKICVTGTNIADYIDVDSVEKSVGKLFDEWSKNGRVYRYTQRIEEVSYRLRWELLSIPTALNIQLPKPLRRRTFVSVRDLFAGAVPDVGMVPLKLELVPSASITRLQRPRLNELLDDLKQTVLRSQYGTSYTKQLERSMTSLQEQANEPRQDSSQYHVEALTEHLDACQRGVDAFYDDLTKRDHPFDYRICKLGLGPRLSPLLYLQQLCNKAGADLASDWKRCITNYGDLLAALQKAKRLVRMARLHSNEDLHKELMNSGHETWNSIEHPEWLLIELESNITIRDVQTVIAFEMMSPRSGCNAAMQLNMGEGKSSVIVPMVAAELANKEQLVRVVVGKPQSKQMAQMLISKLGGMLNRRVYHMPFSRSVKIESEGTVGVIFNIMDECRRHGGVLLVQPEHILSFQLMGLEPYHDTAESRHSIGRRLIDVQHFLDTHSRDIVDESDENFSPKFELIYTMGSQQPIDLSPARWVCIQQVLELVRSVASDIADEFPQSIDLRPRNDGGFPRLRILKAAAGKVLVEKVARRICEQGLDGFPVARQQEHVREAIFKYITQENLTTEEINAVENTGGASFWTESTRPLLYLLRGILARNILTFALGQKRWRVNYGLANERDPPTKLAVPYRAKDNPSPRSEFGHPDIVIVLTCLTYYYCGLEDDDLFIALAHVTRSDQASIEYDAWMKDSPDMPRAFRQLEGVNLKDHPQCINEVFPSLRYGKSVIDYFLGNMVFPKEMKEFPHRLSASGWDIGKKKSHVTTGFSGTNDSSIFLPLDMKNINLESQSHTNALVLEYLLQPENSVTLLPDRPGARTDANNFLEAVVSFTPPTRVILDVGAQILEMSNQQVAERWLEVVEDTQVQAAVFVNDDDELSVVDRRGSLESLQTSSYASRLDACLVFLDEAHTRGIDLRLPTNYRAAVTLGAGLTKDRLVQACMRMRKLGKGQSVVFCVSAEIRAKIQELTAKSSDAVIEVKDVLHWAISETFTEIKRTMPLWAMQGSRFLHQEELWKSAEVNGSPVMTKALAQRFLEDETQSLEARYKPQIDKSFTIADIIDNRSKRSNEIVERCSQFADLEIHSRTLEEEQERELAPEIERERQVEWPPQLAPAPHRLHADVEAFAVHGKLLASSPGYMPAFKALHDTSAAREFKAEQLSTPQLLVTSDFARTVKKPSDDHVSDSFQRPVRWVLSRQTSDHSNVVDTLMIISPYEAQRLYAVLKDNPLVTLHLYKPRSHVVHYAFDDLDLYTKPFRRLRLAIPRFLLVQISLFAGQLYFKGYKDYLETCKFLGLAADVPQDGETVAADGYILSDRNGASKFDKSPVYFLQILMSKIRRNGQDIAKTHVGCMLHGKLLQREDIQEPYTSVLRGPVPHRERRGA